MIILGIGHKARHGKDTAASAILDYYGLANNVKLTHGLKDTLVRVQRVGFADALYELARNEYGMKEKDAPLLQRLGAEKRKDNPEYWIEKAFTRIHTKTDIVVIPDVRYQNEANYIKFHGGYLLKVTRLNKDGSPFVDPSRPADHPSEVELDSYTGWDLQIVNADGHAALVGELAVSYTEYLRGLHK